MTEHATPPAASSATNAGNATGTYATGGHTTGNAPTGGDAAGSGATNAADVGREAKAQAADVAHQAETQLHDALFEVRRDLRDQAAQQTERAGQGLRRLETQLQALRRGDIEAAGPVAGYADQLHAKVQTLAQRVEDDGFDGVVSDLRSFARRRPGLFLASAAAAGFLAGRLARGAMAAAHDDHRANGGSPGSYRVAAPDAGLSRPIAGQGARPGAAPLQDVPPVLTEPATPSLFGEVPPAPRVRP